MTEYEERLVAAVTKFEGMGADIASIKGTMERVADAITRLAVVEERQVQTNAAVGRAFTELDRHEGRIRSLEDAQPLQRQATKIVDKVIWAVVSAVITAVMATVLISRAPAAVKPSAAKAPAVLAQAQ